jgi:hypothetical protein
MIDPSLYLDACATGHMCAFDLKLFGLQLQALFGSCVAGPSILFKYLDRDWAPRKDLK